MSRFFLCLTIFALIASPPKRLKISINIIDVHCGLSISTKLVVYGGLCINFRCRWWLSSEDISKMIRTIIYKRYSIRWCGAGVCSCAFAANERTLQKSQNEMMQYIVRPLDLFLRHSQTYCDVSRFSSPTPQPSTPFAYSALLFIIPGTFVSLLFLFSDSLVRNETIHNLSYGRPKPIWNVHWAHSCRKCNYTVAWTSELCVFARNCQKQRRRRQVKQNMFLSLCNCLSCEYTRNSIIAVRAGMSNLSTQNEILC